MKGILPIPIVYRRFPQNYVNDIRGWAFSQRTIKENIGKLLTLDIDFGSICTLNCPNCFRKNNTVDSNSGRLLGVSDLKKLVVEAKMLGLRSVKFLGAGDPFENKHILEFLEFLKAEAITPLIFTKGHVIGDDPQVRRYFGYRGIFSGEELVNALYELDTSIMLGFNSFNNELQAKFVGTSIEFVEKRNRALMLLIGRGFNRTNPTRLALAINPVTKWNVSEAYSIYRWARLRNMYAIVTPTMISGQASKAGTWRAITPSLDELVDLYSRVYVFNISTGLQSLDQIREEGISAYAGGHPCNQVSTGLYITLNGTVLSCPGSEAAIEGNIWEKPLAVVWFGSNNRLRAGEFNCRCISKDGKSIPTGFYDRVMQAITQEHALELPLQDLHQG